MSLHSLSNQSKEEFYPLNDQLELTENQVSDSKEVSDNKEDIQEETKEETKQETKQETKEKQPFIFKTSFWGYMEMYDTPTEVGKYLDKHQEWFIDCAKPMEAEPIQENGYTITVGRFGSFGYEVEPKMNVLFEVSPEQKYLMYSVEVPDYQPPGYEVEYQASMELSPIALEDSSAILGKYPAKIAKSLPQQVTQVKWELHLEVTVYFPQFIYRLANSVIQKTGDRLLSQIVRQVSPRLTCKVQKNFHDSLNLPLPPKTSRHLEKIT